MQQATLWSMLQKNSFIWIQQRSSPLNSKWSWKIEQQQQTKIPKPMYSDVPPPSQEAFFHYELKIFLCLWQLSLHNSNDTTISSPEVESKPTNWRRAHRCNSSWLSLAEGKVIQGIQLEESLLHVQLRLSFELWGLPSVSFRQSCSRRTAKLLLTRFCPKIGRPFGRYPPSRCKRGNLIHESRSEATEECNQK